MRSKTAKKLMLSAIVAFLTSALSMPYAAARPLEEDVQAYVQVFSSSDKKPHNLAAQNLAWMGLSDTRVFDIIERLLLQDYAAAQDDKRESDRVAHYIRALGYSGQAKYIPTLKKLQGHKIYGRHVKIALEDRPLYEKWNPIIADRASFNPKYDDNANRVLNMLRSDDLLLKRVAAKRVYFDPRQDEVLDTVAEQVQTYYTINDPKSSDAIAWLVKALGSAKNDKYRPLLEQVAAKAPDPKVRDYARNCLAASTRATCSQYVWDIKSGPKESPR